MAVLLTPPYLTFLDDNGLPLAGGKVYTYSAGTVTPKATYTDAGGLTSAPNPITLDASGRPQSGNGSIWIDGSYDIEVRTSSGAVVKNTDNIASFNTSSSSINALLPSQTGNAGKFLQTDGTNVSWAAGSASPLIGTFSNAKMGLTTASASATFTADEVIVGTAIGGSPYKLAMYSQPINLATIGIGGMDVGTAPVSGFVAVYAAFNPTTSTSGIFACNVTTSSGRIYSGANLPAGFTATSLISTWATNGSSQFVVGVQIERRVWRNSFNVLNVASGGSPTTYTSITLTSGIPVNAKTAYFTLGPQANDYCLGSFAADSAGVITKTMGMPTVGSGQVIDGFYSGVQQFDMPMLNPQTMYYKMAAAANSVHLNVNAYDI